MNIASFIDHTILKAEATRRDVHQAVAEAMELGCATVCVNPIFIADVRKMLGSGPSPNPGAGGGREGGLSVRACTVAGFPLGAAKATIKAIEASSAVKEGAQEIDFVAHLPFLLRRDFAAIKAEFLEINKAMRASNSSTISKVILETAVLLKELSPADAESAIELACQAARESGCDFVKTSTGFHSAGGASVEAVRLLKKHSGGLKVKAAGGIRTYDDARRMLDAGADRLGCSATAEIVRQASQS